MSLKLPLELASTYRLTRHLGSGGMGSVYEATVDLERFDFALVVAFNEAAQDSTLRTRNPELLRAQRLARYQLWQRKPRAVLTRICEQHRCPYPKDGRAAVKVLHPHLAAKPVARARFQHEWQALLSLSSPHLVSVFGAGVDESADLHFFAMELMSGMLTEEETLRLSLADKLLVCAQAATGLGVLHRHGIFHRDVKPSNVFVTRREDGLLVSKVADLGIAKNVAAEELTATGDVFGTRYYMAPELLDGSRHASARSDIYALGATLYELLAGEPPYKDLTQAEQIGRLAAGQPPRSLVERTNGAVSPALEDIALAWMAPDPERRPTGMQEVVAQARAFLAAATKDVRRLKTLAPPDSAAAPDAPAGASSAAPGATASSPSETSTSPEAHGPVLASGAAMAVALLVALLPPALVALCAIVLLGLAFAAALIAVEMKGGAAVLRWFGFDRVVADPQAAVRARPFETASLALIPLAIGLSFSAPDPVVWGAAGLLLACGLAPFRRRRAAVAETVVRSGHLVLMKGDQMWLDEGTGDHALGHRVLELAIEARASDVHLEPLDVDFRIRFRVDGILREHQVTNLAMGGLAINQLKVLAELDITERRVPQDGSFSGSMPGKQVDFRVSTIPGVHGEKMVIRILDKTFQLRPLAELGMPAAMSARFSELVRRPQGMLLVTGPSGGGKTTTLYSALRILDANVLNIVTIEDPVEYMLPDICQIPVNPRAGLDYAGALRSSLRQDADVIMVGEVRDDDAAKIAVEASLTSHLVLSTMHADDPLGALLRLVEFGVPVSQLSQGLTAILSQRLLRRLCETCRRREAPTPELLDQLGLDPTLHPTIWAAGKDPACACGGSGYRGRIGVFELMALDEPLRELIRQEAPRGKYIEYLRGLGHMTLKDDAARKAADGVTTLDEVRRVLG